MKKQALDPRSSRLLKKYLTGGAALGVGAGLGTSLINYLKTLKEENDAAADTSHDDDTLYLTLANPKPQMAQPGKSASIGGGLALAGGAAAGIGSYALVRKLYQNFKKKRLQQQLDDAQSAFIDIANEEADSLSGKMASATGGKPMGMLETATAAPVAFTILAALASGALTNRALDKAFPVPRKPTQTGPKKIVLRKKQDPSFYESIEDEGDEKQASTKEAAYDNLDADSIADDGLEFLIHTVLGNTKVAAQSDLFDLVGAVTGGRHEEFCKTAATYGIEAGLASIKGAYAPAEYTRRVLGVSRAVKSAFVRPTLEVLAAAEYADMAPFFVKAAAALPPEQQDLLCKIGSVLGAILRQEVFEEDFDNMFDTSHSEDTATTNKEAGMLSELALEHVLDGVLGEYGEHGGAGLNEDGTPTSESDVMHEGSLKTDGSSGESSDEQDKPSARIVQEDIPDKDEIDAVLSQNNSTFANVPEVPEIEEQVGNKQHSQDPAVF